MKTKIIYAILITVMVIAFACTENQRAKQFGGTSTVNLPKGERLVTATWKGKEGSDLWYLTELMEEGYTPKQKYFREESNFGLLNGTVIFVESK